MASGHPYDPASYPEFNERNRREAAEAARLIFPNFDEDRRRIRAARKSMTRKSA